MRWALRIGPGYPWPKYRGDVITFGNSSREQVEEIRGQMATGEWHDVVELDDAGDVTHRTVETSHRGGFLSSCIDCGATAFNKQPQPPCPGVTT